MAVEASVVMIRLSVPGTLRYRALVLRVVASSCKLLRSASERLQEASHDVAWADEFDAQLVSAIGEAFNNIAIHGYRDGRKGDVELEISLVEDGIEVCIKDHGVTFDLTTTTPKRPSNEPDELPESGMGLFIIGSFVDGITYRPGEPGQHANVLRLVKRFAAVGEAVSAGARSESELP